MENKKKTSFDHQSKSECGTKAEKSECATKEKNDKFDKDADRKDDRGNRRL